MYSASRGIHYTAPPSPADEGEDERTNEIESESESANESERPTDGASVTTSAGETGLAADD
ncbi:hypothetical protein [Natronococcus pandeyae]|uniref:hypothetical protein n=1 Tax=Natronococcus pandeyae TaxID=2055836 RepID=UPI00165306E4|nr:hypothetical protein [Natronococcus pandeyae]